MVSVSPHLYRQAGALRKIDPALIERALTQSAPPERRDLPAILTLAHLAHLTGADPVYLRSVARREKEGYRTFFIRKRSGGRRLIAAPEPVLAEVQRWIAANILNKLTPHPASYAYQPGSSTIKCAKLHLGARWLIKVDIHDFFESIDERRVYCVFREIGYQPLVAFQLGRLCTRISAGKSVRNSRWHSNRKMASSGIPEYSDKLMGHLPQGAPTSPALSNLASKNLDDCLERVARKYDLTYTRYSDDIAFSTGGQFTRAQALKLVVEIERVFFSFAHELNRKKITIAPPGARKLVLGLLVDGNKLKLPRYFRERIRDHVRGIKKFGLANHAKVRNFASVWGMVRHIHGLLMYARAIDANFYASYEVEFDAALRNQGFVTPAEPTK